MDALGSVFAFWKTRRRNETPGTPELVSLRWHWLSLFIRQAREKEATCTDALLTCHLRRGCFPCARPGVFLGLALGGPWGAEPL